MDIFCRVARASLSLLRALSPVAFAATSYSSNKRLPEKITAVYGNYSMGKTPQLRGDKKAGENKHGIARGAETYHPREDRSAHYL